MKANTGSTYGIRIDDSRLRIGRSNVAGNSKADIRLQFGARATFLDGATVGTLTCDGTELVRGNKTPCTPDAKAATKTSNGPSKQ